MSRVLDTRKEVKTKPPGTPEKAAATQLLQPGGKGGEGASQRHLPSSKSGDCACPKLRTRVTAPRCQLGAGSSQCCRVALRNFATRLILEPKNPNMPI